MPVADLTRTRDGVVIHEVPDAKRMRKSNGSEELDKLSVEAPASLPVAGLTRARDGVVIHEVPDAKRMRKSSGSEESDEAPNPMEVGASWQSGNSERSGRDIRDRWASGEGAVKL